MDDKRNIVTGYLHKLVEEKDDPQNHVSLVVLDQADLFDEMVPESWIKEVFAICNGSGMRHFLFTTSNKKRVLELAKRVTFPQNISVIDKDTLGEIITRRIEDGKSDI